MTNNARHLLIAAYGGLAIIFLAALASAIRITLNPEAAPSGFLAAWGGINLAAWGGGWILLRRQSAPSFGTLLLALGDALLPLNLYLVSVTHLPLIAGRVPLSASVAAMLALIYYLFPDFIALLAALLKRPVSLSGSAHQVYLFTICFAVPFYSAHFIFGLPWTTVALMLIGVAGLVTALCRLLDPPLRRHYAVAGMLLILVLVGRFADLFVQRTSGLLLLGIFLATGLLFALMWLNRDAWLGKLLGLAMWATLTLALTATLYSRAIWQTPALMIAAVWVVLLMLIWALIDQKSLAPLTEVAYWFAWVWGAVVVAAIGPLWRSLAALHSVGLRNYRLTGPSSLTVEMPPDDLWRVLALFFIAVSWIGGIILRRARRASAAHARSWETMIENVIGGMPLLLLLAVVSAAGVGAFRAASWVVALLVVTGAAYYWAGSQSERLYPPRSLTIMGYAALVLAVLTASFHLPTTIFALAAVAVILFVFSGWKRSLAAYVLCLIHLVAGTLIISFGIFPQRPMLVLALFYLAFLLLAYWWFYRTRAARTPDFISTKTLISLSGKPDQPMVKAESGHVPIKTLITLTLTILLAAFIIAASIYRREFPPITFLILAATYAPIRYVWESAWRAPARRYADGLWLVGSELAHMAVGLLFYGVLRSRPDFYGLAFAGLSVVYLVGYLISSREPRPLTRTTLMHFAHVFSLVAVILAIRYCPLGIKAALTWLLAMMVHLSLSAREESRWVYPVRVLKVLGYAAIVLAAIHLLWQVVPELAVRVPLPEMLVRETSTLFQVSFLFALGVIFTTIMNRDNSLGHGLLALGFTTAALALVAFVAAPGSALLYSGLLYVYLLVLSRVELRRTSEAAFHPRLPQTNLWLANTLLLLLLGLSALSRQFDPLWLIVVTVGFMILSPGWEPMLPISVRQRFRLVMLAAYALAHTAAAVTVYALLRAYGLALADYGLAFAAVAAMHLLGYWLVQRQRTARFRERVLWVFSHALALLSFILTVAFASRHLNGALAALLLALVSLVIHLLSGRVVYWHVTAYFLIAGIAFIGRAWGVPVWEFYLIPVAVYGGWVFYRLRESERRGEGEKGRRGEALPSPARPHAHRLLRFGLMVGIFILLVAYPAWSFMTTGGLIHLIISGLGAVATIHLFVITRVHSWWIYLIGVVLISEAISITATRQFDTPNIASLIAIGILIIAELGYWVGKARDSG